MNNEQSAYEKWMQHNRRDPEPDPWRKVGLDQARTYRGGIADNPSRFEEER